VDEAFPPVALLFAALVAVLVLLEVVGVVDVVGNVSHSKVSPLSTTTWPEPSPVPLPTVPVGT
jgi:hypothetical protein